MFNRKLLDILNPFPATEDCLYDHYIGVVSASIGVKYNLSAPLMYHRRHGGNVTVPPPFIDRRSKFRKLLSKLKLKVNPLVLNPNRVLALRIVEREYSDSFLPGVSGTYRKAFDYLWRVNLNEECIVLPNIGANIGEVYYVEPSDLPQENNVLGPNAILLKTDEDKYFVFTSLTTDDFQSQLFENVGSSGQPKFNKTELKNINLWIPSLDEQHKIGEVFRNIDNLITLQQRKVQKKNPVSLPDSLHIPYSIFTCLFLYSPNSRRCCGLLFQPRQRRIDKYTELYHTHYDKYQRLQQYTLP
jgi:hypothetical protein